MFCFPMVLNLMFLTNMSIESGMIRIPSNMGNNPGERTNDHRYARSDKDRTLDY